MFLNLIIPSSCSLGWGAKKWEADDKDATCPDDVVPGFHSYSGGDCSRILSASTNKLEGGFCNDDIEKFICQKKKEQTTIQLNASGL